MRPEPNQLLEWIESAVVQHGGDLGGWTRHSDDTLQLFDGRVTLRAEFREGPGTTNTIHAHIFTTLHEYDDEVLDACLFGIGDAKHPAFEQAGLIWVTGVAGPIKSFIDNKPICLTCQAGVVDGIESEGYAHNDYGLPHLRAYVGPGISRSFEGRPDLPIPEGQPWFRFAAEAAAPRRVHLAKVTVIAEGKKGWRRELEIDGHDVSYSDSDWMAGWPAPEFGATIRYAVFEFPHNSTEIARRAELERTIRHFAENYARHSSVDELEQAMVDQGFDAELVHETESISMLAFGRIFFERLGVKYASTVVRARCDGRVEADIPIMSLPAYSRGRALAVRLSETIPHQDFQALCLYSAESNVILKGLEAGGKNVDPAKFTMFPCVVPDFGVSDQTMDAALAKLREFAGRRSASRKKPWWKFWK